MSQIEEKPAANGFKRILREFVPSYFLTERQTMLRLGPKAGGIYARLRVLDTLGVRSANRGTIPPTARRLVFVCHGNIMRSAMAEVLTKQALRQAGLENQLEIVSAGLHATPGKWAHPWAQEACADFGISLAEHRAKSLTLEIVNAADCLLAMDFQNKSEMLAQYPESREKIYMLSAYAVGKEKGREIPDPYLGDIENTRICASQLQVCIHNLIRSIFPKLWLDRLPQPVQNVNQVGHSTQAIKSFTSEH